MDSQVIDRKVRVLCGEKEAAGSLRVLHFSTRDKGRRAMKTALVCFLIAFVCVFIPGAHFVLVPLVLLLTPFVVARSYRINTRVLDSNVTCAICGGALTQLTSQEVFPMYETCISCRRENRLLPSDIQ